MHNSLHGSFEVFGFETSVRLHSASGWAFLVLTIFAAFWMIVTGQSRQFVPVRNNVKSQIMYYMSGIFKNEPHPVPKTAESKLNPLQRITYFALKVLIIPAMFISGLLYMYFNNIDDFFVEKIHLKYRLTLHCLGNENC